MAWGKRSRSGEIVNATILEVFLLFIFLLLISLQAAKAQYDEKLYRDSRDSSRLKSQLADAKQQLVILGPGEFRSQLKPFCKGEDFLFRIELTRAEWFVVETTRNQDSYKKGKSVIISNDLYDFLKPLEEYTRRDGCRH